MSGPQRDGQKLLYSSDIAIMRGVTKETASRWLTSLEKKYGASVVGRIGTSGRGGGGRLYTTEAALQTIAPKWRGPEKDFEMRLRDCEDTIDEQSKAIRRLEEALRKIVRP